MTARLAALLALAMLVGAAIACGIRAPPEPPKPPFQPGCCHAQAAGADGGGR